MNHNGKNELTENGGDPVVSAEYQAMANERTPPSLDSAVLKEAEAAVRTSGLQGFTAYWFRPLAFAASLGIALALLLEYANTDNLQWAPVRDTPPSISSDSENTTKAEEAISSEFDAMIEASSNSMREQEALRDAIIQSLNQPGVREWLANNLKRPNERDAVVNAILQECFKSRGHEADSSENVTRFAIAPRVNPGAPRSCTEELTVGPWSWWQCISDLDDADRHDEARVELEFFISAYPDFPELDCPIPSQ